MFTFDLAEQSNERFNEFRFMRFLKDPTQSVYFLEYNNKDSNRYERNARIAKVSPPGKDYILIYQTRTDFHEINDFHYRDDMDLFAFYFPVKQTMLFMSRYEMGNLDELCFNLKILNMDDVFDEIQLKLSVELASRTEFFIEKFKDQTELIESKRAEMKEKAVRAFVREEKSDTQITLYDYEYKEKFRKYRVLGSYVLYGDTYLTQLVDQYVVDKEESIQYQATRIIALKEEMEIIKHDPVVLKMKAAYEVLNSELAEAKTVWALLADGSKKKVDNKLNVYLKDPRIGDWNCYVSAKDVIGFEYKKKQYLLPNEEE